MTETNRKDLAILILIGAKSTKFGTEKSILDLFGKPLILHQIETLSKFDEDVYLVANSEQQVDKYYRQIKFPRHIEFIIDNKELLEEKALRTPMLGVYSGLKELNNLNFRNGFLETLFAIYPVDKAYKRAEANLRNKIFSLDNLIDRSWNTNYVSVENKLKIYDENLVSLINVNGPIDIEKLIKFYK
jgi:molybdopterin-guanine dinucleotide biosynthesis protein A